MTSCIIAVSGDKRTLCGNVPLSKGVGVTLARWVQAHIDGHDPAWCLECLELWELRSRERTA